MFFINANHVCNFRIRGSGMVAFSHFMLYPNFIRNLEFGGNSLPIYMLKHVLSNSNK